MKKLLLIVALGAAAFYGYRYAQSHGMLGVFDQLDDAQNRDFKSSK